MADIFNWLVEYHQQINLPKCLNHFKDGAILDPDGRPYKEGFGECPHYNGTLVVANGSTLVDRLYEAGFITHKPKEFVNVNNIEDFLNYVFDRPNSDSNEGAFIYDRINGRIMEIIEINNNLEGRLPNGFSFEKFLPENFVSYNGDVDLDKIHLKTRLACRLPLAYEKMETFQIKRTPYTKLGIGKVTHFNDKGLLEEFFFKYNQENNCIDSVKIRYSRNGHDQLVKAGEEIKEVQKL